MNDIKQEYMLRALELAEKGRSYVSPNPMVGCVIVHNSQIIGEGYHEQYGQAHAEVNAIRSVANKSHLNESDVYVTLEPCSHFGKTPPCANLLVEHKVKRVIICNSDPNPLVSGKGVTLLKNAGIEVVENYLSELGLELNKRFFNFFNNKKPYIILKWAETSDGFIARENFDSKWISSLESRTLVHKWRTEEDAILVGFNTALHDDPLLDSRNWAGKNPLRLYIDKNNMLPDAHNLKNNNIPTICYNHVENHMDTNLILKKINFNDEIIPQIMQDLYERKIQSVLVEGGAHVLNKFITTGFWNEARVFTAKATNFGTGIETPQLTNNKLMSTQIVGTDKLNIFTNKFSN